MLDTLIEIGKWKSKKMKPIERFLTKPKLSEGKKYYILNLVFDLDEHRIYTEIYKKFDVVKDPVDFLLLKIRPRRNKKIYPTVEKSNLDKLLISFYGKLEKSVLEKTKYGELYEKVNENKSDKKFLDLLMDVATLKDVLIDIMKDDKKDNELNWKKILTNITLNKGEDIAIIISSIKAKKYGFVSPKPMVHIKDFINFIENELLTNEKTEKKLCYASGSYQENVNRLNLERSISLNKMFVTTTINYATNFNDKLYSSNYQVNSVNQDYLDIASAFLLGNYKVSIAGIQHVMIPTFLSKTDVDFDLILEKFDKQSDLLFKYNDIKKLGTNIADWIDDSLYWLNFLSYDTEGGKSFKTTNFIKDVSKPYFLKIIRTLDDLNNDFSEHYNSKTVFNFYSFHQHIPVKSGNNKNEALELFKDIFEHRTINKDILFKHFTKYLIVQRSGQFDNSKKHRAYSNIREQSNFDYAIKNGVMNYIAFIQFLKKLNLINMNDMEENTKKMKQTETGKSFKDRIEQFFENMGYSDMQKALFYLGRVLSQVAYAQVQSNHPNKPVLNKLNYNGMDKDAILRLHLDLAEKVRQYVTKINLKNVEFNFSRFVEHFNPNNYEKWLSPEENVFYILSGYSFRLIKETDDAENNAAIEKSNNENKM